MVPRVESYPRASAKQDDYYTHIMEQWWPTTMTIETYFYCIKVHDVAKKMI